MTAIESVRARYRIVYLIDDSRREITIFKVGHRKDVCCYVRPIGILRAPRALRGHSSSSLGRT